MPTPRPDFHRFKAVVSYDGTNYAGYQIQPDQPTIQASLEQALTQLTGVQSRVFASGRTDQGVHARGQVIHVDLPRPRDLKRLQIGLNAVLPPDIRIESIRKVKPDFDARFSAQWKEYRYFIWNAPVLTPDVRRFKTHIHRRLDPEVMRQAAATLCGTHDFASFSANPQREVDGTVRTLFALRVKKRGPDVSIEAVGNGFLYKMVRSLAGFLIRVGSGERSADDAKRILDACQRTAEVPTAPPSGLFLWRVSYHPHTESQL